MNRRPSIVQQTQLGPRRDNDAKGMPTQDPELTIGRMSRLYGVSLRRLRSHEDRGLNKTRREGNACYYRGVDQIRIVRGNKLGFALTQAPPGLLRAAA